MTTPPRHRPNLRRLLIAATAALGGAVMLPAGSFAQAPAAFPDKPIRVIVGFPAGVATDSVARLLAQRLTQVKGWNVVVENRPGVSGSLAAAEVVRATPNGYTLLLSAAGPMVTNPNLYKTVSYDATRDFTPISLVANISYVVTVAANSPAKSLDELVALARARPGELNYGSFGVGSTQHLIATTVLTRAGVSMKHVPYKGSMDLMAGAVSGDVAFYVDTAVATTQQVVAGRLRQLGVTSAHRIGTLPDLPTLDQLGMKGFDMPNWLMLLGPAGLPAPIAEMLTREVNALVRSDDLRDRLVKLGADPRGDLGPADLAAFLRTEGVKWKQALEASGARAE